LGLENLKSIFTEGMNKFNNTDVTTMTSNYGPSGIFTQPNAFADKILFQQNFEELNQTQLFGMESTLTIGGGDFTQGDAFSDNILFQQNFQGLNQTQLFPLQSTLTIGGGVFTQPNAFGDNILFQQNFQELSQTQTIGVNYGALTFDSSKSKYGIGGSYEFTQPDVFNDTIYFQQNMYPDGESQLLELNGTSVFQQGMGVPMGGLFNASTTYASSKFIPMSALDVPSIEQILTSGNVGDLSRGIASGGGFPLQKTSYDKYIVAPPGEDLNVSGIAIRTVDGLGNLISDITTNAQGPNETSWSDLYNPNHTSKGIEGPQYSYGSNVNSTFSIRDNAPNVRGLSRNPLGLTQGEPYIISKLPETDGSFSGGRLLNSGNRYLPIGRALTDTLRIGKYLTSASGILFMAKENLHTVIPINVVAEKDIVTGKLTLKRRAQKHHGLNPLSTLISTGGRLLGEGLPNVLVDRTDPLWYDGGKYISGIPAVGRKDEITETFTGASEPITGLSLLKKATDALGFGAPKKYYKNSGDKMTLASMIKGDTLEPGAVTSATTNGLYTNSYTQVNIESKENGMPFYFKDLRDDTYIFFRAYIDGLTENISPTWDPTNYLGRSEPVYVYARSERDISFNLKLFAQTSSELESIYQKMNRLTSLCYPEYAKDIKLGDKLRMKPPLTKFRLGELFGTDNAELTGFIKSLSYTYPSESPWETEAGKRVPKYVQAAISYQVIHTTVPSLDFAKKAAKETFYGLNHPVVTNEETAAGHIGTGVE